MASEDEKILLKWYHVRRVRLTREYLGGLVAGLGLGIVIMAALAECDFLRDYPVSIQFLGFVLIPVGVSVAIFAQDRYRKKSNDGRGRESSSRRVEPRATRDSMPMFAGHAVMREDASPQTWAWHPARRVMTRLARETNPGVALRPRPAIRTAPLRGGRFFPLQHAHVCGTML